MPTYRVTDSVSGVTLDLTGDSPPTDVELSEIFSQYKQPTPEPTPEPVEDQSIFRSVADVPLQFATGVSQGVRFISDAFGADNAVSQNLRGVEDYLGSLLSAQAKNDREEVARIFQDAQDKGLGERLAAGLRALAVSPVDFIAQGLGTAVPTIAGGLAGAALRGGTLAARAATAAKVGTGIGVVGGAGLTKSTIYDEVKNELEALELPEEVVEERARLAQEYGGENLDQILLGAGLGGLAAGTGIEKVLASRILKNAGARTTGALAATKAAAFTGAKEAVPEFIQAAQEQMAGNIALQREGFEDIPTMRGVAEAAALEGSVGFLIGAGIGGIDAAVSPEQRSRYDAARASITNEVDRERELALRLEADQAAQRFMDSLAADNDRRAQGQADQVNLDAEAANARAAASNIAPPTQDEVNALATPFKGADVSGDVQFGISYGQKIARELGDYFPNFGQFSVRQGEVQGDGTYGPEGRAISLGTPTFEVIDSEGKRYGQPLQTFEQANATALSLNKEVINQNVRGAIRNSLDISPQPYDPDTTQRLFTYGYRTLNPEANTFSTVAINEAAKTTGPEYAEGLSWRQVEALPQAKDRRGRVIGYEFRPEGAAEGQPPRIIKGLTKAQEINKARSQEGKPESSVFSLQETKSALGKSFAAITKDVPIDPAIGKQGAINQIRDLIRSKNITSDIASPEINALAKNLTGKDSVQDMDYGDIRLFYKKLAPLPRFERETQLPVFEFKPYSRENFVRASKFIQTANAQGQKPTRDQIIEAAGLSKEDPKIDEKISTLQTDLSKQGVKNTPQKPVTPAREPLALPAPPGQAIDLQSLRDALRAKLKGFGLNDIQLSLERNLITPTGEIMGPESEGFFLPAMRQIFLAVDRVDPDGSLTPEQRLNALAEILDHEVIHAARLLDLWTESEWSTLEKAASRTLKPGTNQTYLQIAQQNYPDQNPVVQMEEAIAEMFRDYSAKRLKISGKPQNLLQRLAQFFERLKSALAGTGFQTYSDVFNRLQTGALGGRQRGEVRTLRATEESVAQTSRIPERLRDILRTPQGRTQYRTDAIRNMISRLSPQASPPAANFARVEAIRESRRATDPVPATIRVGDQEFPTTDSQGRLIYSGYEGPEVFGIETRPTMEGLRNFWRWFGDSKVVGSGRRPLVMYHGTSRDITEFRPKQAGSVFITKDPSFARDFSLDSLGYMRRNFTDFMSDEQVLDVLDKTLARVSAFTPSTWDRVEKIRDDVRADVNANRPIRADAVRDLQEIARTGGSYFFLSNIDTYLPSAPNLIPLYVKAENPFDYDNPEHIKRVLKKVKEISPIDLTDWDIELLRKGDWVTIEGSEGNSPILDSIRQLGFDSMYVEEAGEKNLAVFNPNQIKSAIGNNGDFGPTLSIRESRRVRNPQIDTPEFQRFFRDSKIVDENGEPLVVYHGTGADIETFKASRLGGALGTGIYFTPSPEFAGEYATREGGNIVPAYLAIRNPLVLDGSVSIDPMIEALVKLGIDEDKASRIVEKAYETKGYITTEVKSRATNQGFDGIVQIRNGQIGEIVAFNPNQVKSAVGNVGTFNIYSPSIRESRVSRSTAPDWVPQEVWDAHEKSRQADLFAERGTDDSERGKSRPTLRANATKATKALRNKIDDYFGIDRRSPEGRRFYDIGGEAYELQVRMEEESTRRESAAPSIREARVRNPLEDIVSPEEAQARIRRRLAREPGVGAPRNERVEFKTEGKKPFLVGKITNEDWLDRVSNLLSMEEIKDARAWYQQLDEAFRPIFGDETPKYALAWLLSQKRASPTKGFTDVLRAVDMALGKPQVKIAGLNQQALIDVLSDRIPEGGVGDKLLDFLDSELGLDTRTVVRGDVRGRQPAAIDVWAQRDIGFVDPTVQEYIRKNFGDEAAESLQVDKTTSGETQYEYGIDFYNDVAEMLNRMNFDGGGWTAREVQAVGWVTMQRAMGVDAEFVRDIIGGNTRRISIGLAPGANSALADKLVGKEIPVEVAQREIDFLANLAGIRVKQNVAGVGAYLQWLEGAIQLDAIASPEAVNDFMDMVGYVFQQTEIINTRSLKSGRNMAVDILSPNLDSVDSATKFFSKFLEFAPKNKEGEPIAPGFQQILIDGMPGIRLLNFAGNWRKNEVENIVNAANKAANETKVKLDRSIVSQVVLSSTKNDWKENRNGESYLASLRDRGRLQEAELLQRRYPPSRIDLAGDGSIVWKTGRKGGAARRAAAKEPVIREARRAPPPVTAAPQQPGPAVDTDTTGAAEALNEGQPVNSMGVAIGPVIGDTEPDGTVDISRARIAPITRRLVSQLIQSAPDKLRAGFGLDDLANRIENYYDGYAAKLGIVNNLIRNAYRNIRLGSRDAAMETFERYMRARENKKPNEAMAILNNASESERQLIDAWTQISNETGNINKNVRTPDGEPMKVYDAKLNDGKGGWRPIGTVAAFFPRTLRREVMEVMKNPDLDPELWQSLLDSLVQSGREDIKNPADAEKYLLREWFSDEIKNDYFAGVEKARTEPLPEIFYDYSWDAATRYLNKWARRTSQIENFGQELGQFKKEWFGANLPKIRDQETQNYVNTIRERIYEIEPFDTLSNMANWLNSLATATQLGNPISASLNLFGGTIANIQEFGIRAVAKSYLDLLTDWRKIQEEGTSLGILNKDFMNILRDHVEMDADKYFSKEQRISQSLARFANTALTFGGFNAAENVVRSSAMLAARARLNTFLKKVNDSPDSANVKKFNAWAKRENLNVEALILENGSGRETEKYMRRAVNIPQGSYQIDMTPVFIDTTAGRFFFKYQKFGTQINRFFYNHFLKPILTEEGRRGRNILRALGFVGTAIVGGGAILAIREAFGYGDPGPDLDELDEALKNEDTARAWALILSRSMENIMAAGSFGFFANYAQFAKDWQDQQRVKNPMSPPGLASVDAVIDVFNRLRDQKTITARDLDEIAETTMSFYRANKRIGLAVMDEMGSDAKEVERFAAFRDLREVREYGRRFSDEMGIEFKRSTAPGSPIRTEMTPVNKAITDALHVGDAAAARIIMREAIMGVPPKERQRVRQSIQSSIRNRQPLQIGGNAPSKEERILFMRWAKQNLPKEKVDLILRADREYRRAAARIGMGIS